MVFHAKEPNNETHSSFQTRTDMSYGAAAERVVAFHPGAGVPLRSSGCRVLRGDDADGTRRHPLLTGKENGMPRLNLPCFARFELQLCT